MIPLLTDAFKRAVVAVVREVFPDYGFAGFHEYRVITGTGATGFELQPVDRATMPPLRGVKVWPEGSATTTYLPGATVLVGFVNKNKARPFIGFDGAIVRHGDALVGVTPGAYTVIKLVPP